MAVRKGSAVYGAAGAVVTMLADPSGTAWAGNGLNFIGTGAESLGMGAADVAVTQSTAALILNPAALTRIKVARADLTLNPFYNGFRHSDSLGNDQRVDDFGSAIINGGYAQRSESAPRVVLGAALGVQGGIGFTYSDLQTPAAFGGERDDVSSIFTVLRAAFGGAWQASDTLSLGVVGGVSYASARQKFFPDTSNAAAQFYGYRFDGGQTVQLNGAVGLLYEPTPELRLGLSYTSRIKLPLSGGTLTKNYDAIDQGRVRYGEARIDGLSLPQELSAGFAWQATPRWLLAADVKWLDWSVLRNLRLRASAPDNPDVDQQIDQGSPLNLRDQTVLGVGVAWQYDDRTTWRAGFNTGRNPVPDETLSPVLNLTQTYEIDVGYGRQLNQNWRLDTSLEIIPKQVVHYDNAVFGRSSETFHSYLVAVSIGRSW